MDQPDMLLTRMNFAADWSVTASMAPACRPTARDTQGFR
jgi:hypothetical protein